MTFLQFKFNIEFLHYIVSLKSFVQSKKKKRKFESRFSNFQENHSLEISQFQPILTTENKRDLNNSVQNFQFCTRGAVTGFVSREF